MPAKASVSRAGIISVHAPIRSRVLKSAYALLSHLDDVKDKRPPIHLWQPDRVTESRMRIDVDGNWFHEGAAIERLRLARLFASILRREDDGQYYLITPVEKSRVDVEDAPFVIIGMDVRGSGSSRVITFTTNMAESVVVSDAHPLVFRAGRQEAPLPYVHVRDGLDARVSRAVYYDLMELVEEGAHEGRPWYGISAGGRFFPIQPADATPV